METTANAQPVNEVHGTAAEIEAIKEARKQTILLDKINGKLNFFTVIVILSLVIGFLSIFIR